MPRSSQVLLSRLLLFFLCGTAACAREPISAPATTLQRVGATSAAAKELSYVRDKIAALNSLLARGGGLDQLLSRGADPTVIAERRQLVASDLIEARRRVAELLLGHNVQPLYECLEFQGCSEGDVPNAEDYPCLLNLTADGCFMVAYSTISHTGTGTVYQATYGLFHHTTQTYILDNGASFGAPRGTSNFGLSPQHAANYSFSPADPNCLSGSHDISQETSHNITLGITDAGLAEGSKYSEDLSQCFHKYLTVAVSPETIEIGESASITVGHLPAGGCAYSVTSSNSGVASISNPGTDIWAVMGLAGGTVTITARCPDGRSGSGPLTVAAPPPPPPPPPSGGEPIYRNDYEEGDGWDPSGQWVCMLYWHSWVSWDGGETWEDTGRECINWSWAEESRVGDPAAAPKPRGTRALTRAGLLHVTGEAGNGLFASAASQAPIVTVVVTRKAPGAGLAALTRRATGSSSPIVVRLHESELTPELLGAAFSAVPSLLAREARQRVKDSEYRVGDAVALAPLPAAYKEWLRDIIARLGAGDPQLGSEFGGSRAIRVELSRSP